MPQNFYFLAFSSVSKGWFIKQKRESTLDRNCSCLQLLQRFASLERNHRQVSGHARREWHCHCKERGWRGVSSRPGYNLGATLRSDVLIFSHSQQSKTLNPEKKKKPKPWLMASMGIAEKEGQKEEREDNHSVFCPSLTEHWLWAEPLPPRIKTGLPSTPGSCMGLCD